MKKIMAIVFIMMMLMSMGFVAGYATEATGATEAAGKGAVPALAMEYPAVPVGEPAPFNWAALATVAGTTVATLLIVQYTKPFIPKAIPTRIYVYLVALTIMMAATYMAERGLTLESALLVVLNTFVAATSALGTYDLTYAKSDEMAKLIKSV